MSNSTITNELSENENKLKLYQLVKDRQVNHIYFYEKQMNFYAVQKLKEKIDLYVREVKGRSLQDNILIKHHIPHEII